MVSHHFIYKSEFKSLQMKIHKRIEELTMVEALIWERISTSLALNPIDRRLPVTTWQHKRHF